MEKGGTVKQPVLHFGMGGDIMEEGITGSMERARKAGSPEQAYRAGLADDAGAPLPKMHR